jgi:hypothetical protein
LERTAPDTSLAQALIGAVLREAQQKAAKAYFEDRRSKRSTRFRRAFVIWSKSMVKLGTSLFSNKCTKTQHQLQAPKLKFKPKPRPEQCGPHQGGRCLRLELSGAWSGALKLPSQSFHRNQRGAKLGAGLAGCGWLGIQTGVLVRLPNYDSR